MKSYICKVCGKEFEAKREARTCSGACRTKLSRSIKPSVTCDVTPVTDTEQKIAQVIQGAVVSLDDKTITLLSQAIAKALAPILEQRVDTHQTITPRFEVDDSPLPAITITEAKGDGNSAMNFLNSLAKLQQ